MPKRSLVEQLDQHIQALQADRGRKSTVDPELQELLSVAAMLGDLPRPAFKRELKEELLRSTSMSTSAVSAIREGYRTITPYITVQDPISVVEFMRHTFDAIELMRGTGSAGGYHIETQLGNSMLMVGGGGAWRGTPMPAALHAYVEDADAAYERALAAGAKSLYAPTNQEYGDREAGVADSSGNHWYIGTNKQVGPGRFVPEGMTSVTVAFHPQRADKFIDFLEQALGAKQVELHKSAAGAVMHAKLMIGDSMIEVGEAHGDFQPMPTAIYLYVDDADAVYTRAMHAGCVSLWPPADEDYGDRVGGVQDPFGNHWYPATHIGKTR